VPGRTGNNELAGLSAIIFFTKAAKEKNAENLLIIKDGMLVKAYIENWYNHKEHSEEYEGR
jgi:hypothetical protein